VSKDAEKQAEPDAGKATGERRPRKRRGGLRIPSDNVPRHATDETSAPVPPAVSEDPKLAVSVAVAFGGDGSVPSPAPDAVDEETVVGDEDMVVGDEDMGAHEANGEDSAGIPVPVADDISEPEMIVGSDDEDDEDDQDFDDAATPPPTDRASILRVAPPAAAEPAPIVPRVEPPIEPPAAREPAAPATPAAPAVALDALAGDDAVEVPGVGRSGDSVEIAFDEEDVAQEARDVGGMSRPPRAQTMALSEDDLEEVMEEVAGGAARQAAAARSDDLDSRKTIPMEAVRVEDLPPELRAHVAEPEGPAAVTPPLVAPTRAPSEAEPEQEEDAEPTIAQAAPEAAPAQPHDAGDSGEIISDDLIEEVNEYAAPVAPRRSSTEPGVAEATAQPAASPSTTDSTPPPTPEPPATPPPAPKPKPPPAPKPAARADAVAAAHQGKTRRRRGKPWFEEIFDEDYLRTLPFLTPQATQAEAQFVEEALGVDPGSQVLDVGCGYGRHAMELAARGYHVVALDASLPLLLRGADEAQRRGLDINFVHGDVRELTFDSQFDGAYCLFSTFGFFDDETNKKAAQSIARALKPGARFVVEVLNRDYLIGDLPSRVWWEGDGCVVLEEVEFNYFSSRIVSSRSVVFDDGRQLEQEISIRAYSLHELGKLLHAAGFRVVEISGSMITKGRFFGNQSRDIIVVAERRAPTPGEK